MNITLHHTAAEDMLALLEALGKPCYALVGHDWGALHVWSPGKNLLCLSAQTNFRSQEYLLLMQTDTPPPSPSQAPGQYASGSLSPAAWRHRGLGGRNVWRAMVAPWCRLCAMSVPPNLLLSKRPPVANLTSMHGDYFNYIAYHNEYKRYGETWPVDDPTAVSGPADQEYDSDPENFLLRCYLSGAWGTSQVKAIPFEALEPKKDCRVKSISR